MKKFFISGILAIATAICANAQFRIEASLNASSLRFSENNYSYTSNGGLGFGAKAFYQFVGDEKWGVEAGLGYMNRSTKSEKADSKLLGSTQATLTVHTIELPVHVFYNIQIGNNFAITPLIGIYADGHVAGKTKATTGSYIEVSGEGNPFEGEGAMKRFDIGGDDELLFTISDFTIGLGIQYGFMNMCKDSSIKMSPATTYVAIGWKF